MRKLENVKKWIWIPILLMLAVVAIAIVLILGKANASKSFFTLSERDVLLEIGESKKVELESENKINESKLEVSWTSSKPSVATVNESGTIVASEGGETKVTAVVEYEGKTYITSCMVTVKSEGEEYSLYKIRWYTQKQDRTGYDIQEESFERLIGSSVELTEADASKNLPANYVLNKEKSTLTGEVKKNLNGCILEVYFDVAQINYSVDYYYESDTALGTYPTKETKKYTAYAFSKVEVTEKPKTGFVINESISGTVKSNASVVSGSKLKVYCDRIRSKVTVTYLSGRESAIYDCIYGIGLLNAPDDVFTDSIEYKITTYINGKKKTATQELMKTVTKDTTVAFGLDGVGFTYSLANGISTITNTCSEKKTPCYAILKGSSNTIYLSATYKITGTTSNRFGITLRSGTTSRQIRFYKQGFAIMMDHTTEGGIPTAQDKTNALRNATRYIGNFNGQNAYVWAQNTTGSESKSKTTEVKSIITDMLRNKAGGSYDICWAVSDGVLYCTVEDVPVLCLPLTCLDETWTADQNYQIGFSTYDGSAWEDELQITNVNLALGKNAKALLKLENKNLFEEEKYMVYEPITGSYLPAVKNASSGAAYMYGTEKAGDAGVSATVEWVDTENTASAVGVTIKMGDQSVDYLVQGQNGKIRRQENQKYANNVLKIEAPFTEDGKADVNAFVKDGYFYVMYNGTQIQCINMLSLFPNYNKESSKVSIGFSFWDANLGLAKISNVKALDSGAVANLGAKWGFYSESLDADKYSFEAASVTRNSGGSNKTITLLGSSETWQIDGVMTRPAKTDANEVEPNAYMGFTITSESEDAKTGTSLEIVGIENGFKVRTRTKTDGKWGSKTAWTSYNVPTSNNSTKYSLNTVVTDEFFNADKTATRTQNELGFKAVLYNNTLYVWFDDASNNGEWFDGTSNEGICWRIPLTESKFGGFAAEGTNYEVALYLLNSVGDAVAECSMENLDVKMGDQVTQTTNQIQDKDVVTALGVIEKNIDKWTDSSYKTLTGMLAEELGTAPGAVDAIVAETTYKDAYAYLAGKNSDVYLSATYEIEANTAPKYFGITVKGKGAQDGVEYTRSIYYNGFGISLLMNHRDKYNGIPVLGNNDADYCATNPVAGITWVYSTSTNKNTVSEMLSGAAGTHDIKWAITDNVLYGMVDGFVFLRMPMNQLCTNWKAGTEYQIGFAQWNIPENGDVATTKNIEVSFGEEALAKMVKDKEVSDAETETMVYEVFTGSYLPYQASGTKTLYGVATSGTQVLETTLKLESVNNSSYYGIAVKMTDSENNEKSAVIEARGTNYRLRIKRSVDSNNLYIEDWIRSEAQYFKSLEYKVKAVVKDHTLYIFYGNASGYKLAGSVDLCKLLPGYQEGTAVQLGICATGTKFGLGTFSDVSIATEEAKVTEALTGITLSDDYEWEILTNATGAASYTGTNMTGSVNTEGTKNTVICTPTADTTGAAYIYGVATSMNQKLTTKVNLAESNSTYSSHGITVECGGESVQFYIEGIKTEIRITYGYDWNAYTKVDFTEKLHNNGVYDITAIVKDGTLYIKYNDNVAYKIALNSLFANYGTSSKEVRLGVCSWDILPYNGTVNRLATFSDVSFKAAIDVTEGTITYETIKYATKFNENTNFVFSNDGKITKKTVGIHANMLFTGESTTWEVTGTIKCTATGTSGKAFRPGFRVQQGDKYVTIFGNGNGIGFNGSVAAYDVTSETGKGVHVMSTPRDWTVANTSEISFKAIVSDNILYVWLNGQYAWRVNLLEFSKNNLSFDNTTPYSFGLHIYKTTGNGEFNISSVKTSGIDKTAVENFEQEYQEYAKTLNK